tara:strand:- start:436 stop:729 length:294 start_codon:yes stop_codon:yes gene_type:complete
LSNGYSSTQIKPKLKSEICQLSESVGSGDIINHQKTINNQNKTGGNMPENVETITQYFVDEKGDVVHQIFNKDATDRQIEVGLTKKYVKINKPWAQQ